jgi:hypothetical protein
VCPAILAIAVFHTVVSFAQPSATLTSAAVLRSPTARDAMVERQPPVVLKSCYRRRHQERNSRPPRRGFSRRRPGFEQAAAGAHRRERRVRDPDTR